MLVEPIPVWKKEKQIDQALVDSSIAIYLNQFRWRFSRPRFADFKNNPIRTLLKGPFDPEPGRVIYLHQLCYLLHLNPVKTSLAIQSFLEEYTALPLIALIEALPSISHKDKDKRNNTKSNLWPPLPKNPIDSMTLIDQKGYHPHKLVQEVSDFNAEAEHNRIQKLRHQADTLFKELEDPESEPDLPE